MFTIGTPIGFGLIFRNKEELEQVVQDLTTYISQIKDEQKEEACIFMMGDTTSHEEALKEVAYYFKSKFTD